MHIHYQKLLPQPCKNFNLKTHIIPYSKTVWKLKVKTLAEIWIHQKKIGRLHQLWNL